MKIKTTRFGEIEIEDGRIITVLGGIIGFENHFRYVLLDFLKDSQFKWLQSLNDPALAFVTCDPWDFFGDYSFELSDTDQNELEIENMRDLAALSIVTIPQNISDISLNLVSPLVINLKKMIGKQVILYGTSYKTRHKILLKVKIEDAAEMEKIKIRLRERNPHLTAI